METTICSYFRWHAGPVLRPPLFKMGSLHGQLSFSVWWTLAEMGGFVAAVGHCSPMHFMPSNWPFKALVTPVGCPHAYFAAEHRKDTKMIFGNHIWNAGIVTETCDPVGAAQAGRRWKKFGNWMVRRNSLTKNESLHFVDPEPQNYRQWFQECHWRVPALWHASLDSDLGRFWR